MENDDHDDGDYQDQWTEDEEVLCITHDVGEKPIRKLFAKLVVKKTSTGEPATLRTFLDTGATVNVISLKEYQRLQRQRAAISPIDGNNQASLRMYDRSIAKTLGSAEITITREGRHHRLRFQVIDQDVDVRLSAQTCLRLRLVRIAGDIECVNQLSDDHTRKLETLTDEYRDIFKGLGKLPSAVKLYIRPNAVPVQQPPRRMPVALVEPLIERLQEMEQAGIIERVDYPTDWVSNIVPVDREGKKLRVCLDPHYLNRALERPRFPMPTLEGALHKLRQARIFTAIDARDGFYQVELEESSADATTFWSPLGRYRYRRVPQGISSAPEGYQKRQMQAYEGLNGVIVVADDTLVYGSGRTTEEAAEDHFKNLRALFERAR